ncbi:ThuA domain-containing protein [Streptosporangium lutulentum]
MLHDGFDRTGRAQGTSIRRRGGRGSRGWHGGIVDAFRGSSDYLHLVGGQFACHPGKPEAEQTGEQSDNYVPHRVNILPGAADHPITRGIEDFDLVTEQYWVLADDYCDVLATTTQAVRDGDPWHRPVTSPAIWTRSWGEGGSSCAPPDTGWRCWRIPASGPSSSAACCGRPMSVPAGTDRPANAPVGVGIVGCGAISGQYVTTLRALEGVRLVAVADLDPARAQAVADAHEGVRALPVPALLADEAVDIVLNLTLPAVHAEVALQAIAAARTSTWRNPWPRRPTRPGPSWRPPPNAASGSGAPRTPCSAPGSRRRGGPSTTV